MAFFLGGSGSRKKTYVITYARKNTGSFVSVEVDIDKPVYSDEYIIKHVSNIHHPGGKFTYCNHEAKK